MKGVLAHGSSGVKNELVQWRSGVKTCWSRGAGVNEGLAQGSWGVKRVGPGRLGFEELVGPRGGGGGAR